MVFRLVYNNGDPLLLPPDLSVVIGRSDQCDLQLHDPSASRTHCRVIATDGRVVVSDQGSRWGTFVNGVRIQQCDLRPGDRVTIGETVLTLLADADAHRTTLARRSELERPQGMETMVPESAPSPDVNLDFAGRAMLNQIPIADSADASDFHADSANQPRQHLPPLDGSQLLGRNFHRYFVQQAIATTSSGVVFLAKEVATGRPVVLKLFQPSFFADAVAEKRFERATKTMFGQRHPNIVELYNAGRSEGYCFTVTQLVEGESAVDTIRRVGIAGMLDPTTVLQIAVDLTEALRFAESRGIVHRNIKPSNILIREADRAALLNDLVLAKASTPSGAAQLTQAGDILGDVSYMSPEQLDSGHPIDCRSDIYQLGVTLYALLTGRTPFEGGRVSETIVAVLTKEPKLICDIHLATPAQFDAVVLKMLSKNPRDRYQNADELSQALRKVCAEIGQQHIKPREAPPEKNWGGALDGLM